MGQSFTQVTPAEVTMLQTYLSRQHELRFMQKGSLDLETSRNISKGQIHTLNHPLIPHVRSRNLILWITVNDKIVPNLKTV